MPVSVFWVLKKTYGIIITTGISIIIKSKPNGMWKIIHNNEQSNHEYLRCSLVCIYPRHKISSPTILKKTLVAKLISKISHFLEMDAFP